MAGPAVDVARQPWLFSPRMDLAMFLAPMLLSLLLLAWGAPRGLLEPQGDTPEWTWLALVLLIDVAHVWGTGLRIYTDGHELRRRPCLYGGVPAVCWVAMALLYQCGPLWFWRCIAYAAVWHFVRQQVGWVRLYQRRCGGNGLDIAAIYAATLYPLLWWHTHMPRQFAWMLPGDFVALPAHLTDVAGWWAAGVLAAYWVRAAGQMVRGTPQWGKDAVVLSTVVCWYGGIVFFNSDYAFTVTNIPIHGLPYMLLVYTYGRRRGAGQPFAAGLFTFVAALWGLAFIEEFLWDHILWQERPWVFGRGGLDLTGLQPLMVPLLAVPQLTHYILDGFIWRRRSNPQLATLWRASNAKAA